ncbi:Hypothetical protein SCF082_LOCUS13862 [Durusdinium trenchii]|uniref:Ubiquitin-like domain-containing protein n=1 Tax=Durusdinium trenchii TaxID=1381693 RepID=A0ABP0JTW4_9DINO
MKALFPCFEWLQALRGPKPLPPLNAHEEQVAALETQLQVQLVTLGSIAAEFTVPASMKVSGLHHRVAQELGLPTENQRLILGSTVLEDTESSITEFGETERLVITVLRRRRQQALTAGSSAGFLLWDLESRDFSTALGKGLEPVQCLDVSWGQLRCLAGQSCQLVLWDLGRDQEVDRYEQQGVWGLAVDWSAMKVLSASLELHLWDLKNFMPLNVVKYFAPDARCIAVDWRSGRAITCGECMTLWALDNTVSKVKDLKIGIKPCALAVNWPRCVVAGNGLQLWSIETGTSLPFRAQSEAPVLCVAAAWEAERLVSGAGDGTLRLWSIATRGWTVRVLVEIGRGNRWTLTVTLTLLHLKGHTLTIHNTYTLRGASKRTGCSRWHLLPLQQCSASFIELRLPLRRRSFQCHCIGLRAECSVARPAERLEQAQAVELLGLFATETAVVSGHRTCATLTSFQLSEGSRQDKPP